MCVFCVAYVCCISFLASLLSLCLTDLVIPFLWDFSQFLASASNKETVFSWRSGRERNTTVLFDLLANLFNLLSYFVGHLVLEPSFHSLPANCVIVFVFSCQFYLPSVKRWLCFLWILKACLIRLLDRCIRRLLCKFFYVGIKVILVWLQMLTASIFGLSTLISSYQVCVYPHMSMVPN